MPQEPYYIKVSTKLEQFQVQLCPLKTGALLILCDQFQSLCERMHLIIASFLVGESSLEIVLLLFRGQGRDWFSGEVK